MKTDSFMKVDPGLNFFTYQCNTPTDGSMAMNLNQAGLGTPHLRQKLREQRDPLFHNIHKQIGQDRNVKSQCY